MSVENHTLSQDLIDKLVPQTSYTIEELEQKYPSRNLPTENIVTRVALSPTGSMHIGGVYIALISERIAHQSGGIFYLRIEDTDKKREQAGAQDLIIKAMGDFQIPYDEGVTADGSEKGSYGPYIQSNREEIYKTYVRHMLMQGIAYPCFVTADEQASIVSRQNAAKTRPGYYGEWAIWRGKSEDEVRQALEEGKEFVIRYRSSGDVGRKTLVKDRIRGDREMPQNDNDIVVLKSGGLPTYHLAHVIDDHLMRTSLVIRADEWLPSTTLHIQLAESLSFEPFEYAHIAPIQKIDNGTRRKLSKRKDPESSAEYYVVEGYPVVAVIEYLLNQSNSNFEDWRRDNPDTSYKDFPFSIQKLPTHAGGLLNLDKMNDVSQNYLGRLSVDELYTQILNWATTFDMDFAHILTSNTEYAHKVLSVERDSKNTRKDLVTLSQAQQVYGFFFDEIFESFAADIAKNESLSKIDSADLTAILTNFMEAYDPSDSQEEWFGKLKDIGSALGYTPNMKDYRKNPEDYKGSVADIAMVLRVSLTGKNQSPNLYEVMGILGKEKVFARLRRALNT